MQLAKYLEGLDKIKAGLATLRGYAWKCVVRDKEQAATLFSSMEAGARALNFTEALKKS